MRLEQRSLEVGLLLQIEMRSQGPLNIWMLPSTAQLRNGLAEWLSELVGP